MRALQDDSSITCDVILDENIPTNRGMLSGVEWLRIEHERFGDSTEIVYGVLPDGRKTGYLRRKQNAR